MKQIVVIVAIIASANGLAFGQLNFRITSNSAGGIKLGMTVEQAQSSLRGCRFTRSSDGERIALIAVSCRSRHLMSLYAGEEDADAEINWKRRIEFIEVWDKRFKTVDGIHPEMKLRNAEKILGRVQQIIISPIESREYVTFRRVRKGIRYRTYGGVYARRNSTTTKYEPGSQIFSIQVSKN
ncbi:MAG: hypothetical protein KF881_04690 [Acidobacteria bacterium]|nr:hypothetical protein [Acidobacteriota bacterium]